MRDAIDARIWDDHHEQFSADLARFFAGIGAGFARLNRIRWAAPWGREGRRLSLNGPAQA